ncbi:hypothetical protein [Thauera sinica]|uniref:Uncharacterized protein n=1 Tax=Thauera sinica TaxID=2665146 RepID=A0ABW1ATD0_9RHOO|nr:hypothetical protein [Thauera sp. K11]
MEIQRTSLELRNLKDLLGGLGFDVIETTDYPAITSEKMEMCSTAADAFELAKEIRTAMQGPADIDSTFQLGAVLEFSCYPPRRHAFLEAQSGVIRIQGGTSTMTIGPPCELSEHALAVWWEQQAEKEYQTALERQRARLEPAFRNENAAKVLDLLSKKNQTGSTLYKIYELAEGHPKNRKAFHTQFGISADEFQRFGDAVHNSAVSGDWARHAYDDTPKSAKPMSKAEAESFVRRLAAKWLENLREV